MPPVTLNCSEAGWGFNLLANLENRREVDLMNFDYPVHGKFCEELAKQFSFRISHDPKEKILRFRNPD